MLSTSLDQFLLLVSLIKYINVTDALQKSGIVDVHLNIRTVTPEEAPPRIAVWTSYVKMGLQQLVETDQTLRTVSSY